MDIEQIEKRLQQNFDLHLRDAAIRASNIRFQNIIPMYWFSSAVSQSHQLFIQGNFYAVITTSQAYIEALGKFLCEKNILKAAKNDAVKDWEFLFKKNIIHSDTLKAARSIYTGRNDFHHMNKFVETNYQKLSEIALDCLNNICTIETDVFAYEFDNGKLIPRTPKYWPHLDGSNQASVFIRNI